MKKPLKTRTFFFPTIVNALLLAALLFATGCPGSGGDPIPDTTPPAALVDLAAVTSTTAPGAIRITWTAVGDDGNEGGPATRYEVRYSTTPFSAGAFDTATLYSQAWTPSGPGTTESKDMAGLPPSSTVYVALKVYDAVDNASGLSDVVFAASSSNDLPPSRISDLSAWASTTVDGGIDLSWTAPGQDGFGGGPASGYEVRISASVIDETNWSSATIYSQSWVPGAPSNTELHTLTGLTPGSAWYVALKATDAAAQLSPLSNCVVATARDDQTPPGTVTDLAGQPGTAVGTVDLTWTAPGDDGATGTATSYEIRYATSAINGTNFTSANLFSQSWSPVPGGGQETRSVGGLTPGALYYFALVTSDNIPNVSPVSNCASAVAADTFTVVVGPANPAATANLTPSMTAVLQVRVYNLGSEGISVSSLSFTDGGNANLTAVLDVYALVDSGPSPGFYDAGDPWIENAPHQFAGSTVTIAVSPSHVIAAGTSQDWILVYDFRKATSGYFQARIDPTTQISAVGAVSGTPITAAGPLVTGNQLSYPPPIPASWWSVAASGGPGTKLYHTAVFDTPRDRILFFGGQTGGGASSVTSAVHALSTFTVGSEAWSALSPTGTPPAARYGHVAVYDATAGRMVVFGGKDSTGTVLSDTWEFLPAAAGGMGAWNQLSPGGIAAPALAHCSAVYDPTSDSMILFGGEDGSGNFVNSTYVLTLGSSPSWRLQATTNTPGTRVRHVAALDLTSNSMMIFSGLGPSGFPPPMSTPFRLDTSLLDLNTWQWSTVSSGYAPVLPRYDAMMTLDSSKRRAWVFGGLGGTNLAGPIQDVAFFDFPTGTWWSVALTGTPHGAGGGAAGAYDSRNSRLVVQGGSDSGTHDTR